ncbi:MAG TPA: hypothetical protein VJV03_03465 [Pyrinomonadaceae bacterium]|nr:hypothetical protein [Pyrinomonadaceae bacterium]
MSDGNEQQIKGSRIKLSEPRFDEHAHLRAQPVQPIPKSAVTQFFEKLFAHGSTSLALIVILGFITGAVIGVSLVGQNTSAPDTNDQALAVPQEGHLQQLEGAEIGVYGIQTDRGMIRSAGNRRPRGATNGQPRAYRFAVIR